MKKIFLLFSLICLIALITTGCFGDSSSNEFPIADKDKQSITHVTIPKNVTEIQEESLSECKNLKKVIIPNSVNTIGYRAFYSCESLSELNIPESVTEIEEDAFKNCYSLKTINIPNKITSIKEITNNNPNKKLIFFIFPKTKVYNN